MIRRGLDRAGSGLKGALLAVLLCGPAIADDGSEARLHAYVDAALAQAVIPSHAAFASAAHSQAEALTPLCATPDAAELETARDKFASLALAWSRIELYRFGPAREDNLFERLFFWPDRRGRGLRQVQGILGSEDPAATDTALLRQKSVAVQGLPALEFALFGTGAQSLTRSDGAYRCRYAAAVAQTIDQHAAELFRAWMGADGFAQLLRTPGPGNPLYRSGGEVLQDFLRAASEQVEIVRDLKLSAALGDTPQAAKPRRAPFTRSGLALAAMAENLRAASALLAGEALPSLLPPPEQRHAAALRFEFQQALRILDRLAEDRRPWETLAREDASRADLQYTLIPLAGAQKLLRETYPAALGLTLGFNSLDGD